MVEKEKSMQLDQHEGRKKKRRKLNTTSSKMLTQEITRFVAPEPSDDKACLVFMTGIDMGRPVIIDQSRGHFVIGRNRTSDLQIDASEISRFHVRLEFLPGKEVRLVDLESRNGSFVNGHQVREAYLRPGDKIRLGPHVLLKFSFLDEQESDYLGQMFNRVSCDALTGVMNRRYFIDTFERECSFAKRHHLPLSVAMLDIDFFKRVNDTYGHLVGDDVLKVFTQRVLKAIRKEDLLARFGGEEFSVLFRQTELEHVGQISERIRKSVSGELFDVGDLKLQITVSIGTVTMYPSGDLDCQEQLHSLLKIADDNLYKAKQGGRDQVVYSDA